MDLKKGHWEKYSKRNKTVVVIGAVSSIGETLVSELMEEYESIILTESSKNYTHLLEKYGERVAQNDVHLLELDVLKREHIQKLESLIQEKKMIVDSMIYLAGINMLVPALEVTEDIWDKIMNINLKGFFFLSQAIVPNLILNGGGSILGIASQHGV